MALAIQSSRYILKFLAFFLQTDRLRRVGIEAPSPEPKNCCGLYSCRWATSTFYVSFNSDLIFGLFRLFGALSVYSWCRGRVQKLFLGGTHVVEQLLLSIVPSILTFDLDLILGSFLTFGVVGLLGFGCCWAVTKIDSVGLFWIGFMRDFINRFAVKQHESASNNKFEACFSVRIK